MLLLAFLRIIEFLLTRILVPELKHTAVGDLIESHYNLVNSGKPLLHAMLITLWRCLLLIWASIQIYLDDVLSNARITFAKQKPTAFRLKEVVLMEPLSVVVILAMASMFRSIRKQNYGGVQITVKRFEKKNLTHILVDTEPLIDCHEIEDIVFTHSQGLTYKKLWTSYCEESYWPALPVQTTHQKMDWQTTSWEKKFYQNTMTNRLACWILKLI